MRHFARLIQTSLLTLSAIAATTPLLHADDTSGKAHLSPMIEVGGGSHSTGNGVDVLVKTGIGLRADSVEVHGYKPLGTEQLIWFHFTADGAISTTGGKAFPFADVTATLVHDRLQWATDENTGNITYGEGRILNGQLSRNINIDQSLMVRASVVAVQIGVVQNPDQAVALYGQLGADLAGYKLAAHVSNLPTFHGVHISTGTAEAGAVFRLTQDFAVRLSVGGSADINISTSTGQLQSDYGAYAAIRADIFKYFQLFVQAGLNGNWDGQSSTSNGGTQIMTGLTFLY